MFKLKKIKINRFLLFFRIILIFRLGYLVRYLLSIRLYVFFYIFLKINQLLSSLKSLNNLFCVFNRPND